jgi:nucleoside-diphosphate-sugar epimerase
LTTVLIAGATGVIGDAVLTRFAAEPGVTVVAVSRRAPAAADGRRIRHLALDLTDAEACRRVAADLGDVTHVVFTAVAEQPGLVEGWRDPRQMQTNLAMLSNLLAPLSEAARLEHLTLLQGAKAYGGHAGRLAPIPARERAPRDTHENFYWLQEDHVRERAAAHGFAWTIFRPSVVIGAAWGAVMNPLLPLGAYAALRREEGKPFSYPGGVAQISEIVGADLLAEAFLWAGRTPAAHGETFNITNGDAFSWRDAWPALAEAFGVEVGPDEPMRLAPWLIERAGLWDSLVARDGLQPIALAAFLGESHHYADILLRKDAEAIGRPTLLSTIKLRQAGFAGCRDSEDSLRGWVRELQLRRLLPA